MCTTYLKYSIERTKTVQRQSLWKKSPWCNHATMFNWTTFNCWFKTSSDKVEIVSHSVSQCEQCWDSLLL